jgi:catechol 2,3-dioxygenase-like lactoylglutathione lyase family enzyme
MRQAIGAVTLLVRDYDEAISFYREKVGFSVVEDTDLGGGKRWVLLAPPGSNEARLLLARARTGEELSAVGRQAGGRVFLFLHTDNFERDHREMRRLGVKFREEPRQEAYGTVAVFEDLYGNAWDLLMPRQAAPRR